MYWRIFVMFANSTGVYSLASTPVSVRTTFKDKYQCS